MKSVFFRIREIKYKEKFTNNENLYPGNYIIEIAKEIIKKNSLEKFEDFESTYEKLKKDSIDQSMELIKFDLKLLGIKHDYFF